MKETFIRIKENKRLIWAIKIICCCYVFFVLFEALFVNGLKPYYRYKDYNYQNDFSEGQSTILDGTNQIEQHFIARGNILDNISVYLGDISEKEIRLSVYSVGGTEIASALINSTDYNSNAWNKIHNLNIENMERNKEYVISLSSESGLSGVVVSSGNAPIIFGECIIGDEQIDDHLAVGIQFTYKYMTLGSIFELLMAVFFHFLMGIAMCFAIFRIQDLLKVFSESDNKEGILTALFFSVSAALAFNPLETINNEVTEFGRVIGRGLIANVDVSKRISNFSHWFILFAVSFVLFYLLSNYFYKKKMSDEGGKAIDFLRNYMVLANCCLLLRIITYFNDETASITAVYYFTSYAVMLVAVIVICYIAFNLDKTISFGNYARIHFAGVSVSLPIAIFIAMEWEKGRVVLGIWFTIALLIILYCKYFFDEKKEKKLESDLEVVSFMTSLLPLLTSLYIEVIHIMNQYYMFVAHPANYYKMTILLFVILIISLIIIRRIIEFDVSKLWNLSILVFVFGISCLSIQIPISSTYNPDLFEGANYSILISDFLNYGTIPIVQHYGGHMMTFVWEGIIYGLINGDYFGAAVSPYSSLMLPLLVVLFYFFVRKVWDERQAVFVALLFPFYYFWSYYGLGMLICVAAIAYIKKNTYVRAALLWGAVVWCAIYRLDLGFAFGIALIFSMFTYVFVTKNRKAIKELGITLAAWAFAGGLLWFIISLVKGVNPINRLIEFLMISLSNQNWAYTGIGNVENTLFGWSYIVVPFLVVLGLLHTTFSKSMRERIGMEKWILLLIMGWSYFENFSRGLVRHSLAEMQTTIVIWSGYLFLAMFISAYKNDNRLFLPAYMILILCNTLFVQDGNFKDASIVEKAMDQPSLIIESWEPTRFSKEEYEEAKLAQDRLIENGSAVDEEDLLPEHYMTYWEQVKYDREKVERVKLDNNLIRYVNKYRILTEAILSEDETFVDFINKTLIYSLLGKEDPVYISQSPLQLSGEFTQTEYIKEISGVPIVFMPIDADNYKFSNSLDGITNLYRNYKVGEYIFQNYTPLCQYGNDYAVWCLNDRLDDYTLKIESLVKGTDYIHQLSQAENIGMRNVELKQNEAGSVEMKFTGIDPMITELQRIIDISDFVDRDMCICVDYTTDIDGHMQLFYTTDLGENYTVDKVVTENISGSGTAYFTIPVTEYSRIRLDTPEGSTVELKSLVATYPIKLIDYGYDGPNANADASGNVSYSYISALHNHNINQLPRIWAEVDKKEAVDNSVVAEAEYENGLFIFDPTQIDKSNGNYCRVSITYDGMDRNGLYENDDEQLVATMVMGSYNNGTFEEKCRYTLSLKEGTHYYLIRCSTDYYWYLNEISALKLQTDGVVYDVSVSILEGD